MRRHPGYPSVACTNTLTRGLGKLLKPEGSVGRTEFYGLLIPVARLGRIWLEIIDDTEPFQHNGIIGFTQRKRHLRIPALGRPAQNQSR